MIKKLFIQNFESHLRSIVEFSPGVNCIIGNTDSGKSAVIRALQWVITNRPLGDSFCSHWGGDTVVDLTLEKDVTITREKGKNNYYKISDIEKPLNAPGTSVPEPVLKTLNIEEINSQYQLDRPFLLLNTPGEVAKYLNKIVNWENIDKAQSIIKSRKQNINRDIKSKTYDLEKKQERLKDFNYLGDFENDIRSLEKKYKTYQESKEKYTRLFKTVQEITEIKKQIKDNKKNYPSEEEIDSFVEKVNKLQEMKSKYTEMEVYLNKISTLKINLRNTIKTLTELKNKYEKLSPENCPLCGQRIKK